MKKLLITLVSLFLLSSSYAQIYLVGSFKNLDKPCSAGEFKKIGDTDVFKFELEVPAGSYKFLLIDGAGTKSKYGESSITLKKKEKITFYAKSVNQYVCSAEKLYVIGKAVGGWTAEFAQPMEMTTESATFKTDFTAANFNIVKINDGKIIWNAVTLGDAGKKKINSGTQTVTFDFATFEISIKR